MYGCTDFQTINYDLNSVYSDNSCIYDCDLNEENDNITLINADPNQKHNRIADQYESTANKEFRALKVDTWVYKNEKLMNGGKFDGVGGHDPNGICHFAALEL